MEEILLNAPCNTITSYSVATRYFLKELSKTHRITLFPIGGLSGFSEEKELISNAINNQKDYNKNSPGIKLFHQNNLAENPSHSLRIGFPIYELTSFNEIELNHLRNQDALFVCSSWAKEVIEKNNIEVPTYVVPLGSDLSIFNPHVVPAVVPPGFNCLSIGKIEKRKGHLFLPKVFKRAFPNDATLWMMWHNRFLTESEVKEWESYYREILGDRVQFIPWRQHPKEVASIMAGMDCVINPSLAEGFGLPILDAIFMNKPVITTRYSAMTDYCNEGNSFLIDVDKTEPAFDGKWFFGQGEWASYGEEQFEQMVHHLRFIYENRPTFNNTNFVQEWTWEKAAEKLTKSLERISCG